MPHLSQHNDKLIQRIRRLKGQLAGVERMLSESEDCYRILQTVTACRGALNGLTRELILSHIDHHLIECKDDAGAVQTGSLELRSIIESYLK